METKKTYQKPVITTWGKVTDLTQVGCTHPGGDVQHGSVLHSNATGNGTFCDQ